MMVEHRFENDEVEHEGLYELAPSEGPVPDADVEAERREEGKKAKKTFFAFSSPPLRTA